MPAPDTSVITLAMSVGGVVIVGLIGAVWKLVRDEAKTNAAALDKKASHEALKEAKSDFHARLEQQQAYYQQRLNEVSGRQDREIDWLKNEMDKISENLAEMRRENNAANAIILQRLQDLAMAVGTVRT